MSRVAPLLPFARAPDVQDLLELMDGNWFGRSIPESFPNIRSSPGAHIDYIQQYSDPLPRPNHRRQQSRGNNRSTSEDRQTSAPLFTSHQDELGSSLGLEDGLGTWAERQQVFTKAVLESDYGIDDRDVAPPQRIAYASALLQEESPFEAQTAQIAPTIQSLERQSSEDADMNAAWRWRFSRKWQQEQLRQVEGGTSVGNLDDDDWASALDYMAAAAAGGLNLQFGRTPSIEQSSGSLEPSFSQALLLEASMSKEASLAHSEGMSVLGDTTPMASKRIAKAVRKAEQLMAHQAEIERQVAERWESADAQQPWAAQSIPAVNIDSWGNFPFILARVMDGPTGRQKLLIRGHNRFSIKQAGEMLRQEIAAEAASKRLSVPKVDILGSGQMEWSRDRDRCLIITGCAVHSALDTRLRRKEDVGRVAGALARTGLPALHQVVVVSDGQTGSSAANKRSSGS